MFSFGLIEKYLAVSYLLSCTAKIPKIMGVANKKNPDAMPRPYMHFMLLYFASMQIF